MKLHRFLYSGLLFLLIGCSHNTAVAPPALPPSTPADHSITLSWTQSFADNFACSSTVTTSCMSSYTEGYMNGTTPVTLHTDTMAVCTGATQPETCTTTFSSPLPIGAVSFFITLNYVDSTGAANSLTPVTTASPIQISADAPVGLVASVK